MAYSEKINDMFYTSILAGFVIAILIYLILNRSTRKYPPGPTGLPIVGYYPFLTKKPYIKLQELKAKYGPIFSLRIGSRYVIVLADYKSIKDAFSQDAFLGLPPDSVFEFSKDTTETQAMSGVGSKEQRKFILYMLRDLGVFKSRLEEHIKEEICELLQRISMESGRNIVFNKFLAPSTSNNISTLVFGKRRPFDDSKRIMMDKVLREIGQSTGQIAWQSFFPWLKIISKFIGMYNHGLASFQKMRNYIREEVEKHEVTLDETNIRDFIDGFLLEIQRRKNEPKTTFLKPVLEDQISSLFGAGSEAVRVSLDWLMLVTATRHDVMKNVQSEIDDVIGQSRFPRKSDSKQMPYTEAVIMELMRWRTIVPINVLKYTLKDTQLGPYFIPKHSYVISNLWGILHDPNLWGSDAEEFKPERFLSGEGKSIRKPDYFIPFSTGKRQCPGEPLAQIEVFLYYAAILQKFDVSLPEGATPDFEGQLGLSLQAKPHEICLKLREDDRR